MPGAEKVHEHCQLHEAVASFPEGMDIKHWGSEFSCARPGMSLVRPA
jgi:hypothetical protein